MRTESGHAVSTLTELNYLKGLGFRPVGSAQVSRVAMLRGYLAGVAQRRRWAPISERVIVAYVTGELRAALAGESRLDTALSPQAEKPGFSDPL